MSKSKIFIIIIIGIISILILTGCNKQEQEGTIQTSQENTEKFSVEYNGVQVVPGTEFNAETIGEEAEFSEIPSCAFAGTDKVYTYAGMEITVATIDSKDKVYSVYFIDASVETEEGVKITDSKEKMIEKSSTVKSIFKNIANPAFEIFYIGNGKATIYDHSEGEPKSYIV